MFRAGPEECATEEIKLLSCFSELTFHRLSKVLLIQEVITPNPLVIMGQRIMEREIYGVTPLTDKLFRASL